MIGGLGDEPAEIDQAAWARLCGLQIVVDDGQPPGTARVLSGDCGVTIAGLEAQPSQGQEG